MSSTTILDSVIGAVRAVREHTAVEAPKLTERILADDAEALAEGQAISDAISRLAALSDSEADVNLIELEHLVGVRTIVDAMLIAIGEDVSDDPEVNERFRTVRMERHRGWVEQSIDDLVTASHERGLDDVETEWLDTCGPTW